MGRKVLTGAATMEIKRLYSLVDSYGKPLYSQMQIAKMLGVGETTVFRAVHKIGAYERVQDLPTDTQAKTSMDDVLGRLMKTHPHLVPKEYSNGLGEVEEKEAGDAALEKMQAMLEMEQKKREAGSKMLDELIDDDNDFMKGCGV